MSQQSNEGWVGAEQTVSQGPPDHVESEEEYAQRRQREAEQGAADAARGHEIAGDTKTSDEPVAEAD